MSLVDTLVTAGFDCALIIDDAYDEAPVAADLTDAGNWSVFVADLTAEDKAKIEGVYPHFKTLGAQDLRESDEFVRIAYSLKGTLRPDLWSVLFEDYERAQASDRAFLQQLEERLTAVGLKVVKCGRQLTGEAKSCKIVFADLFLGASQQDFDIDRSVARVGELVSDRAGDPPAVVLMSRSPLLTSKKERFRDDAKMVGAMFRVYGKQDLLDGTTVETVLERLAKSFPDGVRVANFLAAWESSLRSAASDFMKVTRRLDLSDYCKIRDVLLNAEGQPLGSYMLDVFDRVLQHQIEGQKPTIEAALELNRIDSSSYPAPYIAGSPFLQDFVIRVLWQHPERLRIPGNTEGMPVSFGDVLVRKIGKEQPQGSTEASALVVLTPACDLVRNPKGRVLLIAGEIKAINNKTWRYKTKRPTTPVLDLSDRPRAFIEWNFDDQRMLDRNELDTMTGADGNYDLSLRLRESNALNIQQGVLSHLGRIGLVSALPFTFPVEVHLYSCNPDGTTRAIDLPVTSADGGVWIAGRDTKNDIARLILTEASADEILNFISELRVDQVSSRAKDVLATLQSSDAFRTALHMGLDVSAVDHNLTEFRVKRADQNATDVVGLIVRNPPTFPATLPPTQQKAAAMVIVIRDVDQADVAV